jgi:hypothetical protein
MSEYQYGRKHELAVGARYGMLVVTQTRPGLVMRCDCGVVVTNRVPSHVITSRLKSCGCLRKANKKKAGDQHNSWTLVELLQDGANAYMRRWSCRCRCGFMSSKWEADLKPAVTACVTCRRNEQRQVDT